MTAPQEADALARFERALPPVLKPASEGHFAADDAQAQLRMAAELGNVATWRHDFETDIVWLDARTSAVLGFAPPDGRMTVAQLRSLMHPDDWEPMQAASDTALRSNRPVDFVARYRRADGGWRSVLLRRTVQRAPDGRPLAFFGTAMDVTEQLERDRREQELIARFDLVRRSVGFGTWFLDLMTDQAIWDEQMWALRGRAAVHGFVSNADRDACIHPEERETLAAKMDAAMASGKPFEHEFRVILPNGDERWLASRSMELRDDLAGTRRRFGVNWDITDSRTTAQARREREIAETEMRARSQFLSRMSHELRTPLNAVIGFAELLLAREGADTPESALRSRQIEHIRNAGEHLLVLINDVLDVTSLESGELRIERQAVPLAALLVETAALLEPARLAAGVELQFGASNGSVLADPRRLRQVLLNLLSNAIKYNRAGGLVRVEVAPRGDSQCVCISDNGRGMSAAQLQHLFEPFNRLGRDDGQVEGSGIGLVIAKALVERMGGSVHVESTEGQGSRFEVRLAAAPDLPAGPGAGAGAGAGADAGAGAAPAAQPAGAATPTLSEPAAPAMLQRAQRRVLYIEDNPVNALIITELLARRRDLKLIVAVDGQSGVTEARRLQPDLILLDMQLPDFDGFEVLRRLQADPLTAAIPCVALSANAMPEDIQRALAAGLAGYWTKPLDFKRFMAALDGLFRSA
ncbi:MAG: ATP-binding protein [Pseudomonadota bacterium]|nr:ATP-binding protein [Pseudomonadota bacterium]